MILKFLKPLYYEFLSYFVPRIVRYKVTGECKKCGKCCNYMYSQDTYTEKEFKIMQFMYPSYKRFKIMGEDSQGNLIFGCKLVSDEGLCTVYDKRLPMCKNYPAKYIYFNGKMHEGCGFNVSPEKKFKDFLN